VRSLSSAQMESASTTVPSIVVYVTVPNREAGSHTYLLSYIVIVLFIEAIAY
jgi:hypothetical protein